MKSMLVYPLGCTDALRYAAGLLHKNRIPLIDHPAPEVTHLLLDIPSFSPDGTLRCGGSVEKILEMLPPETVVIGGNLRHPGLNSHRTVDFLRDELYLALNAAITADCTLKIVSPKMLSTFSDSSVLIIGWGRIGKCLVRLLTGVGANVTVACRNEAHRGTLQSLGIRAVDLNTSLRPYDLIINTVPAPVFPQENTNAIQIDLASQKGLPGDDVIWARGLPGRLAPESSGRLIANTFLRLFKEDIS